jgi:uncharacterized spore protein YtfJ
VTHIEETVRGNGATAAVPSQLGEIFGRAARADAVFGKPVEHDGCQVIPVARARLGFGGGRRLAGERPGEGGAGGLKIEPVGFILARGGDAEFRPIRTGMAVPLALAAGFVLGRIVGRRR